MRPANKLLRSLAHKKSVVWINTQNKELCIPMSLSSELPRYQIFAL